VRCDRRIVILRIRVAVAAHTLDVASSSPTVVIVHDVVIARARVVPDARPDRRRPTFDDRAHRSAPELGARVPRAGATMSTRASCDARVVIHPLEGGTGL